jgi:DNA-binding transcriptional regulator YiaG
MERALAMAKSDIRDRPAYTVAEAARYLKVAPATLRSWFVGRPYPTGSAPRIPSL